MRKAASESQIASNRRLILIQDKAPQSNKILIGRSRVKSRTFVNLAAKLMW